MTAPTDDAKAAATLADAEQAVEAALLLGDFRRARSCARAWLAAATEPEARRRAEARLAFLAPDPRATGLALLAAALFVTLVVVYVL